MSWDIYRTKLSSGESVSFRPHGNSMLPRIKSGQLVEVSPDKTNISVGDIVFCKVKGSYFVHLVKAIKEGPRYLITNNKGHENGWIGEAQIYGVVIRVSD